MSERIRMATTSKWAYLIYGLLLGIILILSLRLITYSAPDETHYHANFAVYLDGTRETFEGTHYYEEVSICNLHDNMTPKMRTHMHNEENGVVHVHHDGVTWGQFFENLGWMVGPDFLRTNERLYTADEMNKLNIVLNGDNLTGLTTITNQLIGDKDRLLVSFGDVSNDELDRQYDSVLNNAEEYNNKPDPAACSGEHEATMADRFKNLF